MRRPDRERITGMPQVPKPRPLAAPQSPSIRARWLDENEPRKLSGKEVTKLTISIPLVVVLGAFVWLAWRYMGLRTWQAVLCMLLGFLLAATSSAPAIRHIVTGVVQSLTGH